MNINLLAVSTGQGYGVAHNNKTGKDTYMKVFFAGFGVKNVRGIFVFDNFVEQSWSVEGQEDAAAKYDQEGLAAQATIQGTKYWKDDELN